MSKDDERACSVMQTIIGLVALAAIVALVNWLGVEPPLTFN